MQRFLDRCKYLLAALLFAFTASVSATSMVFADDTPLGEVAPSQNGKIVICHATDSDTNPYVQITVDQDAADGDTTNDNGKGDHLLEHTGPVWNATLKASHTKWGDIIPPITGKTTGLNWLAGQTIYYNGCTVPVNLSVTPGACVVAGSQTGTLTIDISGTSSTLKLYVDGVLNQVINDTTTLPITVSGLSAGSHIVALRQGNDTVATQTVVIPTCSPNTPTTPAAVAVTDTCGLVNDGFTVPQSNSQVTYSSSRVGNVLTVVATPGAGVVLVAGNGFTLNQDGSATFTYTFTNEACVVPACTVSKGSTEVNVDTQFADSQDTRSSGHYDFTADGLHIYTDDATTNAKVAWYHNVTPYSLADAGEPSMNYTVNSGTKPGLQMVVDFNGDGTPDGILVGESSVYGNDWWLSNSSAQFVKDGAPSHSGGFGSGNHGTLSQWLTSFPNAKVTAVGFSLGSGVKADGVLHSLTFGCFTWTFKEAQKTPVTPVKVIVEDKCGLVHDMFTVPENGNGVTYVGAKVGNVLTVVATPASGYVLVAGNGYLPNQNGSATFTYTFTNHECPRHDMCKNIPGIQTMVPEDMVRDENGNCTEECVDTPTLYAPALNFSNLNSYDHHKHHDRDDDEDEDCETPPPVDQCKNIDGLQVQVPNGMVRDDNGNCHTTPPVDVCKNISGDQATVPEGKVRDNEGNCVTPTPPADVCLNLQGIQLSIPSGYKLDTAGNCVENGTVLGETTTTPASPVPTPTTPAGGSGAAVLADTGQSTILPTILAALLPIVAAISYFAPRRRTEY